jgi:hypothetical protein
MMSFLGAKLLVAHPKDTKLAFLLHASVPLGCYRAVRALAEKAGALRGFAKHPRRGGSVRPPEAGWRVGGDKPDSNRVGLSPLQWNWLFCKPLKSAILLYYGFGTF